MKYSKKILSIITIVAIISRIPPINSIIINAQENDIHSFQTQEKSLQSNININGLITKGISTQSYINDITLTGSTYEEFTNQFKIKFNTKEKKIKITDMCGNDNPINSNFNNKRYISVVLFDQDRNIKKILSLKGNDPVSKAYEELNDLEFEYGDRLKIYHAQAGSQVKISGDVIDKTSNFNEGVSKDILSEYDFKITESGLQQVKAIKYILNNKITLAGVGCQEGTHRFELLLDPQTKKLKVKILNGLGYTGTHPFHPSFEDEYINVKLLDKDGNVKKELSMKGTDNVKIVNALNDVDFKYGDRLRFFHAEADWRAKIEGNVYNTNGDIIDLKEGTSEEILNNYDFKITKFGLQLVSRITNELNNTKISLLGLGDCPQSPSQGPYHKFELTLDPLTKKLKVDNLVGLDGCGNPEFHPYFGDDEYVNVTLFDKYGNIKKELSLTGNDNVTKAKEVLNDVDFEYGDRLKIRHREANQRAKIEGNVYDISGNKIDLSIRTSNDILNNYYFEITKSGLQLVHTFEDGLDRTKITLAGAGCQEGTHRFELTLDPETKHLDINILNGLGDGHTHPFHPYFQNEYINIKLLDKDGNIKKEVSLKGPENVKIIKDALNEADFKYGDRLRISHAEADWRTKIEGNVYNSSGILENLSAATSKLILDNYDFEITTSGLKEIPQFTNELNKTKISLLGLGDCPQSPSQGPYHKFELTLDTLTKKLKVDNLVGLDGCGDPKFHPYFGDDEYVNVTLFDKYGEIKEELSLTGNDNVQKAQDILNDVEFEYGDYLSISHAEANGRTKIEGNVYDISGNKIDLSERISKDILKRYNFRITKLGLQEICKYRYYPFIIDNKDVSTTVIKNLIDFNGSFEETTETGRDISLWKDNIKPKNWEVQAYGSGIAPKGEIVSNTRSIDGNNTVKLKLENSVGFFKTTTNSSPNIESGKEYKLNTHIKTEDLNTPILIKVEQLDSTGNTISGSQKDIHITTSGSNDWAEVSGTITAAENADRLRIVVQNRWLSTPVSGNVYLDEFSLEKLN